MNIDNFRYETWEVQALVSHIESANPFLLNTFFGGVNLSEAANIEWDIEEGGKRIAPFVSPYVAGKPIRSTGHMTQTFKPAYVKPKKTIDPRQGYVRMAGEPYGGTLSPRERLDRLLTKQIKLHEDMLTNRLEWMASKVLTDGAVTVTGEDYPTAVVDFAQNSNLRATLGSTVEWDDTLGDPLQDIEDMALKIRKYSYGAVANRVVMDGLAWKLMRTKLKADLNFTTTQRVGSSSMEIGPRANIDGEHVGDLAGRFSLWVYDGAYEDEDGVVTKFLPDYTAIIASDAIQGQQYFGAIQDLAAMVPARMFHKTKENWDPSGLELLSQSAPMVAPRRRNAYGRITVKT